MNSGGLPAADVEITAELVGSLLREQHPDLADLAIRELANGWDNVLYRLGEKYTVRLPRRAEAAELVGNEIRWLPELATRLPLAIPSGSYRPTDQRLPLCLDSAAVVRR